MVLNNNFTTVDVWSAIGSQRENINYKTLCMCKKTTTVCVHIFTHTVRTNPPVSTLLAAGEGMFVVTGWCHSCYYTCCSTIPHLLPKHTSCCSSSSAPSVVLLSSGGVWQAAVNTLIRGGGGEEGRMAVQFTGEWQVVSHEWGSGPAVK